MGLVNAESMAETLDGVSEALFWGRKLGKAEREEVAKWLASRQGMPGAYAGMFAPPEDYRDQRLATLFGERRSSRAGARLVLGNEACRALVLLDVGRKDVQEALASAREGMLSRLGPLDSGNGMYCCTSCTPAVWRNLAAGGVDGAEAYLASGVRTLRGRRLGDGKWQRFPFWYTLLALSEMPVEEAAEEVRYAVPVCEALLGRKAREGKYDERRRELARRVLEG
jgi:hypothetical protein